MNIEQEAHKLVRDILAAVDRPLASVRISLVQDLISQVMKFAEQAGQYVLSEFGHGLITEFRTIPNAPHCAEVSCISAPAFAAAVRRDLRATRRRTLADVYRLVENKPCRCFSDVYWYLDSASGAASESTPTVNRRPDEPGLQAGLSDSAGDESPA